jgi:hypothetical protein
VTLSGAMSADPGGGVCDAAGIAAPVAYLTALANDPERLRAVRTLVPASDERRRYAAAFERAFASNLRIVRLEAAVNYRDDPEPLEPHIRTFLEEVSAREGALQFHPAGPVATGADSVGASIHDGRFDGAAQAGSRLVDLDGHAVHVYTAGWEHIGRGLPIVVFEAGAIQAWGRLPARLAEAAGDPRLPIFRGKLERLELPRDSEGEGVPRREGTSHDP